MTFGSAMSGAFPWRWHDGGMREATEPDFDGISLEALRRRQSAKWRAYPDDVLPAWVAEMDFALAAPVKQALLAAVGLDDCGYAYPDPRLDEAFAGFAQRRWAWQVDPGRVRLVPDVMVGIAEVLGALTEPGDRVVVNTPVYPPFFSTIAQIGRRAARPVAVARRRGGRTCRGTHLRVEGVEPRRTEMRPGGRGLLGDAGAPEGHAGRPPLSLRAARPARLDGRLPAG